MTIELNSETIADAQLAVMKAITNLAGAQTPAIFASQIKDLTEAYAWLAFPNSSHGGSTNVTTS